jgi:hypothetical protein
MTNELFKFVFQNTVTGLSALAALFAFMFFKEFLSFKLKMRKLESGIPDDETDQRSVRRKRQSLQVTDLWMTRR